LLAGAAILAAAFTSAAHGQSSGSGNGSGTTTADSTRADDAAWQMPRGHQGGPTGVVLPRPLRPGDVVLMRRISPFNPAAISPAGARGLMQIMPVMAQFIVGDLAYNPSRLHDPAANLDIGQLIPHLANQEGIDNDLIRLLAGYNSGGGSFRRWSADVRDNGDPLLFIEAIPIAETRGFVAPVLLYSWLYTARLHLPADSLDALAANEFPRFTPRTRERKMALLTPG
jgi:hypothetical protein